MNVIDCYKILEINFGAPWADVKRAYRLLAKKYHPDKSSEDLKRTSRFQEISKAYQILDGHYRKNNKRRIRQKPVWTPAPYNPPEVKCNTLSQPITLGNPECFGIVQRFHEAVFQLEKSWFPLDIFQGVTVDPQTAQLGGVIRVRTANEVFNVKLPNGTHHGIQLCIPGRGQRSWMYNKRGDLYLKLRVIPDGVVRPGTTNLFYEMEIRREDLGLGKVFTLHTLQGPIKFFPPKSTQNGQVFILKTSPDDSVKKKINHILTVKLSSKTSL